MLKVANVFQLNKIDDQQRISSFTLLLKTGGTLKLTTLKKRSDYLRLRGGARCPTSSFVLETRPRTDKDIKEECHAPRFGFTVTKALGKAVDRNRIRRRLKAAVKDVAEKCALPQYDYVLIARRAAIDIPFCALKKDLEHAFRRVHQKKRDERT